MRITERATWRKADSEKTVPSAPHPDYRSSGGPAASEGGVTRMIQPDGRLDSLAGAITARAGRAFILTALLVLAFSIVGSPRAYAHYGADGADGQPSTLYWIEPDTLAATRIGPVGFALVGIARGHDDGN